MTGAGRLEAVWNKASGSLLSSSVYLHLKPSHGSASLTPGDHGSLYIWGMVDRAGENIFSKSVRRVEQGKPAGNVRFSLSASSMSRRVRRRG